MPTLRERLAARIRRTARRTLGRLSGLLQQPAPSPQPPRPAPPPPSRPTRLPTPSTRLPAPSTRQPPPVGGGAFPRLRLRPRTLDFGEVDLGSDETLLVEIRNAGNVAVTISGLSRPRAPFTVETPESTHLEPGEATTFLVGFAPDEVGDYSGKIAVHSNAPTVSLALAGTGVEFVDLELQGEPPTALPSPAAPAGDAVELLGQLANLTLATNEIVHRLRKMGYTDAADAVLGVPRTPPAPTPRPELPPVAPGVPTAPAVSPELPAPPSPAPPAPPQEPPPEPPEPDLPEPEPERPGKRYPLRGSNIYIPHLVPDDAFDTLLSEWDRARIGLKGDDPDAAIPPYAPDAIARGNSADPGMQIPPGALRSRSAFLEWANENGYGEGMSIVVDGLIAMPGRTVIASPGRPADPAPRRTWTPPAEPAEPAQPATPAEPEATDQGGFDWSTGEPSDDEGA